MSLTRTVDATVEPWTTAEAKSHLRVTVSDHDAYIDSLIKAARQHVENYTGRALMSQTWVKKIDGGWPIYRINGEDQRRIVLPPPPLLSVESVQYVDLNGDTQTLAADQYTVEGRSYIAVLCEVYGVTWPSVRNQANAVTITFKAGYHATSAAAIPQAIRQAILLLAGSWFVNREAVVIGTISADLPHGVEALLFPFRTFWSE